MADPLFPNPSDAEGPAAWIVREQRGAQSSALQGLDANADDGARAIELGNATGADPAVVHGNLDQFEQQHKAALTSQLLQSNQFLRDYANSHSMAPIVSNDDWGQLDSVSQRVQNLVGPTAGRLLNAPGDIAESAVKAFAEPFKRGFGEGIIDRPGDKEFQQSHPYLYATLANLALTADIPVELFNRTIEGVLGAGGAALETGAQALGASPESAADIKQAALATADTLMLMGMTGQAHVGEPGAAKPKTPPPVDPGFEKFYQAVKPYLEQGEKPPVGVDPIIDKLYSEQAKLDMKNLDEVVKEAGKSSTRERAPELFENFIRQHTDAKIGIDAEAVRKLYGDKQPEPGDGILGDVPGLADQLALAEAHGGDVEVPLATWIAKIEPEVAKELHDSIRVRPGGMTLEEAKAPKAEAGPEPKAGEEVAPPTAIDTIARAAGLRPEGWDVAEEASQLEALEPEERGSFIPADAVQPGEQLKLGDKTILPTHTFPASSILKNIDPAILNPLPREIYTFLKPIMNKLAGEIPVHVITEGDMQKMVDALATGARGSPGLHVTWDTGYREIFLTDQIVTGHPSHATHIIMHEIAHGATVRAIDNIPVVKEAIRALMNEADKQLSKQDRTEHAYAFKNEAEFVAEAFSKQHFQEVLATTRMTPELAKALGIGKGPRTLWDAFREMVRNVLEKVSGKAWPNTILDGVLQIGKIVEQLDARDEASMHPEGATVDPGPRQPDLPGIVKPEGVFDRPSALGMNKERATRYRELIKRQQDALAEAATKERQDLERERQTKEWKENYGRVRAEVVADLKNRPDIAADRFLRLGELYGEKTKRVPLDREQLTPEQIKSLPKDYVAAEGISPDDVAGLFGYSTGDALVAALSRLEAERQLEGLTPQAHYANLVNAETERQMRKTYGDLEKNILDEAKDHVLSPTQMDILHEEMVALGEKAGGPKGQAISKEDIKAWVKGEFDKTPVGSHSTDKYLAAAGRAGQAAEDGLLKGDAVEAYKAKQQQVIAMHLAGLAKKLEKEQATDARLRKRLSVAEPTGIAPEYAIWAQDIISRTGGFVRRTIQGIERQKELISDSKDLRSFVESVNSKQGIWGDDPDAMPVGAQMPVADFLLDPNYRKAAEDMTTEEWRAVAGSLKTMDKNGREIQSYNVKGDKRELKEVVSGLIERLKAAVGGKRLNTTPDQPTSAGRTIGSLLLNPETWFLRLDLGNRKGPFSQLITRKVVEGQYTKATLEREVSKEYREIGDFPDNNKKIENNLFKDAEGNLLDLKKENLWAILANMGNELQRKKLAGGYGIKDPNQVLQWVFAQTTKEDWQRAQRMGEFFNRLFAKSETMYSALNGYVPDRINLGKIETPWGPMAEWYHPLIPDPLRRGPGLKAGDMMEESGYFRPSPASGYTKGRTGAIYPIDLSFRGITTKISQMIADIAMRPAITEVSKVLLDKNFQNTFTAYYGKEYQRALVPWLRDAAGQRRYVPSTDAAVDGALNFIRENMSTLMIGFNLGTVMKHAPTALAFSMREVGPIKFADSFKKIIMQHETPDGQSRRQFAMENSEELQNRLRSTKESISASNEDMFRSYSWDHKFFSIRDAIQLAGAYPVAMSDFLSAVPMWDAKYWGEIEKGETHGDAVDAANTAVRRTHGSSIITNRPAIMRMNPWVQSFLPFYNFFNNGLQRLYEYSWKAKMALTGRTLPEMTGFEQEQFAKGKKHLPEILGGFLTFGVLVSLIEQAVDPLPQDAGESSIKHGAKVIARGPIAMIPGLRDFMNAAWEGHSPSSGLIGSFYQDITKPITSTGKVYDPAKVIRRVNDALGALTGLTYAEVGKVGEYTYNVMHNKERPRDVWDYYRGIRHGTQKERK